MRAHPSPRLLAEYAAGDLALEPALAVAAHTHLCPRCRAAADAAQDAEGERLAGAAEAELAPGLLERTLARLDEPVERPEPCRRMSVGDIRLPTPVARVGVGRRRFVAPDFWVAPVRTSQREGWRTYILRAPAGARIPRHRHKGPELICVLTGAFADREVFRAGDFIEGGGEAEHELRILRDGPCACLVSSQGGADWRGVLRLAAPALGV